MSPKKKSFGGDDITILQMRKLGLREVGGLTEGHTAYPWQSWNSQFDSRCSFTWEGVSGEVKI